MLGDVYNALCSGCLFDGNFFCYALFQFSVSITVHVFQFYYVYFFLDIYGVSQYCFQISQFSFIIWNIVNEVFFGWLQDHASVVWLRSRQLNILYCGPLFGFAFLFGWFKFYDIFSLRGDYWPCIHLIATLYFWTTVLSFLHMAHCSLFTEVTFDHNSRVRLTKYQRVAAICGFWAVPLVEYGYDSFNETGLYCSLIFIALLASVFTFMTGYFTESRINRTKLEELFDHKHLEELSLFSSQYLRLNLEILWNRKFLSFVAMQFLAVGLHNFGANFTKIITEDLNLFEETKLGKLLFFLINSIGGNVLVLFFTPFLERFGSDVVTKASFFVVIISSVSLYFFQNSFLVIIHLMVINLVSTGVSILANIFVSNIIEEDQILHRRPLPLSSMFFALTSVLSKPAQSVFPMVAAYILDHNRVSEKGVIPSKRSSESIVNLLICLPIVTSVLQLIVFSPFSLNHHSKTTKDWRFNGNFTEKELDTVS